jgi:two-component sensor histidine kinase
LFYDDLEERNRCVQTFAREGLLLGEKVTLFLTGSNEEDLARRLGLKQAIQAGTVELLDSSVGYLRQGRFDPGATLRALVEAVHAALGEGFAGLRVAGELNCVLQAGVDPQAILDYELRAERVLSGLPCSALCLYERRKFPAESLLEILSAHPHAVIDAQTVVNHHFRHTHAANAESSRAARLERAMQELREVRTRSLELRQRGDELEELVSRRTRELRRINKNLREEIARRKRTEASLTQAVEERDVLLRELHHRVKNNLQTITSLLSLQVSKTGDDCQKSALRDLEDRVRAIAMVHSLLHRSSVGQVAFGEYAESVCHGLAQTYGLSGRVAIDVQASEPMLDPDRAIPLGLILTELVSNALKHAFPDNRQGTIRVSMETRDGTATLRVSDDGVGMTQDPAEESGTSSMGLELVGILAEQLDGHMGQEGEDGTTCFVEFPLEPNPGYGP